MTTLAVSEPPDAGSGRVESLADLLRAFNHQDRVGHPYLHNHTRRSESSWAVSTGLLT